MNWSQSIDLYCERTGPSFWSEPVNAVSNVSFLIAALIAFLQWRRADSRDWPPLVLIALTAAIGVGSFIFHTVATRGAALFDTVPIAVFICGYLFFALRRYLGLSLVVSLAWLTAFVAFSCAEIAIVPSGTLNGSHAYLPAVGVTLLLGWMTRQQAAGRLLIAAGATLALSLIFRSIDVEICRAFPLGSHFLWHSLNGAALYLLLRSAALRPTIEPGNAVTGLLGRAAADRHIA